MKVKELFDVLSACVDIEVLRMEPAPDAWEKGADYATVAKGRKKELQKYADCDVISFVPAAHFEGRLYI